MSSQYPWSLRSTEAQSGRRESRLLQIGTNLAGAILLTRALLPRLRAVVNVRSDLATCGMADLTVSCATRFGLRGFTQALCVNPDRLATGMYDF